MSADRLTLGDKLQIAFRRAGDRYSHAILLVRGSGDAETVLSSCEGTPEQWWPASPPLQQLHLTDLENGRRAALLVGMAGRSHWSLSVVADSERHELLFDAACRATLKPDRLGSQYRAASGANLAQGPETRIRLGPDTCTIALDPIAGENAARLCLSERDLRIELPCLDRSLPATFRWKYRVALQTE